MTATRALLPDFNLANPLYASADVTVYEADEDGVATATLATIYDGLTSAGTLSNPLTLDAEGKWVTPPYVDVAVIMAITGATVADHQTGVAGPPAPAVGDNTDWTPVLSFGGSTAGITYSNQYGSYNRIGNLIFFEASFILTSKGAAAGSAVATIAGLPGLPSVQGNFNVNVGFAANFSGVTGLPLCILKTNDAGGPIDLYHPTLNGNTETARLTNSNFSNSTNLYFTGWYRVAA